MELCRSVDQHEFVYSHIYARQFTYRWRYELVAIHSHYFSWQHHCAHSNDLKRQSRREIWYSLPGFCKGKFWRERCKHSSHVKSYSCMRLVWHTNLDWRLCIIPDDQGVDAINRKFSGSIS